MGVETVDAVSLAKGHHDRIWLLQSDGGETRLVADGADEAASWLGSLQQWRGSSPRRALLQAAIAEALGPRGKATLSEGEFTRWLCLAATWGETPEVCALLRAGAPVGGDRRGRGRTPLPLPLEPPRDPTTLPCGHSFCTGCVSELRAKGVSETCPLCRAPLPPGPEKLYELGLRVWQKIVRAVGSNCAWPPLSASQQDEMDGAIVMLQEAMDQVSWSNLMEPA